MKIEVLFTPADFAALKSRNLNDAWCVVFDVFRATTSMITALTNGAEAIIPVAEIPDALALRHENPEILLAGERDGVRIRGHLTGGIDFDLGNSPREFTREKVARKVIAMTTTNGTRALKASAHAKRVMVASFLNLGATADLILRERPSTVVIICSGTFEQAAYEDTLAAGALCDRIWDQSDDGQIPDSALMARRLFQFAKGDLLAAALQSRNGRRLSANPELTDDVPFSLRRDTCRFAAELQADGRIRACRDTSVAAD